MQLHNVFEYKKQTELEAEIAIVNHAIKIDGKAILNCF